MGKKSVFNSLFSKSASDKSDSLLDAAFYLQQLADVYLGINARIDAEINKFNSMLKEGVSTHEITNQIDVLRNLVQAKDGAAVAAENVGTNGLNSLPAVDFVNALLNEPIDASVKVQLKYYLKSLDNNTSANEVLGDIVRLLSPEPDLEIFDGKESKSELDNVEFTALKDPIVKLLKSIQNDSKLAGSAGQLLHRVNEVNDNKGMLAVLEDTSELILSSLDSKTDQFEHFLLTLKERLEKVDSFVNLQHQTNTAIADCGDKLSLSMNEQVGELRTSMSDSSSLEELESHVASSIDTILNDLESFNRSRDTLQNNSQNQIQDLEEQLKAARQETENLRDNLHKQRQRAMTDALTHLPNRESYDERLKLEYQRWQRYDTPLSLVMADLDHFKKINDNNGHTCGDYVLQEVANILKEQLRETDFVARYGGEEFVILLPETNVKEAVIAMNKLRSVIQQHPFVFEKREFAITMSFGVATFENKDDYNLVFNRADTALYRAKSRGRNQVCAELKKSAK